MIATTAAGALAFAIEPLTDGLWNELSPLLYRTWDDASDDGEPALEPDRDAYEKLHAGGALRIFTARLEPPHPSRGRMVGYAAFIVCTSTHHSSQVIAVHDAAYLEPDHRRGGAALELLRFADDALVGEGVHAIQQSARAGSPFSAVLARLGYRAAEITYRRRIHA